MRGFVVLILATVAVQVLARPESDWTRFDHRSFRVTLTRGGDRVQIADDRDTADVKLLGLDAPVTLDPTTGRPGHGAEASAKYLAARAQDQVVILRLDTLQPREPDGALRAYVYLSDSDCLNADMLHDGLAFSDRRVQHAYSPQYDEVESDARKHRRGMWAGLTTDQMPAWRRAWMAAHGIAR